MSTISSSNNIFGILLICLEVGLTVDSLGNYAVNTCFSIEQYVGKLVALQLDKLISVILFAKFGHSSHDSCSVICCSILKPFTYIYGSILSQFLLLITISRKSVYIGQKISCNVKRTAKM